MLDNNAVISRKTFVFSGESRVTEKTVSLGTIESLKKIVLRQLFQWKESSKLPNGVNIECLCAAVSQFVLHRGLVHTGCAMINITAAPLSMIHTCLETLP